LFMPVWTAWTMSGRMGDCVDVSICPAFAKPQNPKFCVPIVPRMLSVVCVCSPNFHLELRKAATNLEDIGDGDGVLGGLALGGENGDRGPRHCGLWALLLS
jgi:hypothetical protein